VITRVAIFLLFCPTSIFPLVHFFRGLQHRIHGFVLGNLYPGAEVIDRILAPEWGVEKAILDVGTGPGHWALEMAKKFPHCHVVGVDLAPRTNMPFIPPNLRLEFDDANLGFPHYHGCFDVIHARSISNGINDYEEFVAELERCLRPGGAMILIDGEPPILDHNGLPLQPAYGDAPYPETKGWMARILHEAGKNMSSRGGRVMTDSPHQIARAFIQTGKLCPPVIRTLYIPIGPWPVGSTPEETDWIRHLGEMMRQNAFEFIRSLRPILKSQGFSEETLNLFIYGAQRELHELTVPMYSRWAYGYAIKPLHPLPQSHFKREFYVAWTS